jgi:CRP/FNR family transcriptional regulator
MVPESSEQMTATMPGQVSPAAAFAKRHDDQGCRVCPTRHVCTARGLDPDALDRLSDCIDTTRALGRNDHLYRAGDSADSCFVVRSGVFKTLLVSAGGDETVTGFHYPGELIGFSALAAGTHQESAQAIASSTACRIRYSTIRDLFACGAGNALLELLAEREQNDRLQAINLRQSKADHKIAGFFSLLMLRLERLGYSSTTLPMPMSRTDLANHLGLTLECVSRLLGKWKRAGVISTERDLVRVHKPGEIATLAYHLA